MDQNRLRHRLRRIQQRGRGRLVKAQPALVRAGRARQTVPASDSLHAGLAELAPAELALAELAQAELAPAELAQAGRAQVVLEPALLAQGHREAEEEEADRTAAGQHTVAAGLRTAAGLLPSGLGHTLLGSPERFPFEPPASETGSC